VLRCVTLCCIIKNGYMDVIFSFPFSAAMMRSSVKVMSKIFPSVFQCKVRLRA